MKPADTPNMVAASLFSCSAESVLVILAQPDSNKLPQKRPMVPAWVLSSPAFQKPLDMRSSITCADGNTDLKSVFCCFFLFF